MARIDDFIQARVLAREGLLEKDINSIIDFSGGLSKTDDSGRLRSFLLRFLNRDVIVTCPEMEFSYNGSGEDVPVQQQVLLLHYLNGACGPGAVRGKTDWVSFQDLPEGRFYMDAFMKRAKEPLLRTFGSNPKKMAELAMNLYNASPTDLGDVSVVVKALPRVPVALVLWQGDDEFPPEGNLLFDKGISEILPAEDIALLAGMVVYPLIGMMKN